MNHEAAAANAGALRLDQIEHELDGDRGVRGAAAGAKDLTAGFCRERIGGGDHGAGRGSDLPGDAPCRRLGRGGLLGCGNAVKGEKSREGEGCGR